MTSYIVKCLKCGAIHEHKEPIAVADGDAKNYVCKNCQQVGTPKILQGGKGMYVNNLICDRCEKPCNDIYETAEGDYVCIDCHTKYREED